MTGRIIDADGDALVNIDRLTAQVETLKRERDEARIQVEAERDAAQAEAAAMIASIKHVIVESAKLTGRTDEAWLPFVLRVIDNAAVDPSIRALAARVPLWRELEDLTTGVNKGCDWIVKAGHEEDEHDPDCASCQIDEVLAKLAAVDTKETK